MTASRSSEVWHQASFVNNREYSVGAAYQFQGLRVAASYAQQNNPLAANNGASDTSAFAAFGVPGNFLYQHASGNSAVAWIYNANNGGVSSSNNQTSAKIGLRHRFRFRF